MDNLADNLCGMLALSDVELEQWLKRSGLKESDQWHAVFHTRATLLLMVLVSHMPTAYRQGKLCKPLVADTLEVSSYCAPASAAASQALCHMT